MTTPIQLNDLIGSLPSRPDSDGWTISELCAAWNCGREKARRYLAQAKEAGLLKRGQRAMERIDGQRQPVPVYSFVTPEKKKR